MSTEPVGPIEYSAQPPAISRRSFRLLLALTLLNTVMLTWFVAGPQGWHFAKVTWENWQAERAARKLEAQLLASQRQCMNHAYPAGTVVYTEDLARAAALDKADGSHRRIQASNVTVPEWPAPLGLNPPAEWLALHSPKNAGFGFGSGDVSPIVFLHERRTPRGETRLVVVRLEARQRFDTASTNANTVLTLRQLEAFAFVPLAAGSRARSTRDAAVRLKLPEPDVIDVKRAADGSYTTTEVPRLTVFGGQADETDPTHFTIPYDIDGKPGMIDGWVRNDDILMKPRSGIPKFDAGAQIWELGTGPATAPATRP